MNRTLFGLVVCASLSSSAGAASIPSLYWSETGGVVSSLLDGSQITTVSPGFEVGGLALDRAHDRLFFTDILPLGGPQPGGVIRAGDSDGQGFASIVNLLEAPAALTIDRVSERVIWSDRDARTITIAGYDGSDPKTILPFSESISEIAGLAFDPWRQKVYFSYVNPLIDSLTPGDIARMNLDGSELETVVSGLVSPQGIAVDHVRERVYWADQLALMAGIINSAKFDGSDRQKNVTEVTAPRGVAFDPYSSQLYWTDNATGKIHTQTPLVEIVDLVSDRPSPVAIGLLFHSGVAGDTNDDGQVDLTDLNNVRNNFGATDTSVGDADLDGDVDLDDLNAVRNHFGTRFMPPESATAVPEPATAWLGIIVLLGAVATAQRARKTPTSVRR